LDTRAEKYPDASLLSDEFVRELVAVGEVDLLVGIPTLNDAQTVGHVAQAAQVGFGKYFSRERAVLINADGGSRDGTPEVFMNCSMETSRGPLPSHPLRTIHRITTVYRDAPDPGAALRTILAAADLLRAKAVAIVSGALTGVNPAWIDNLLRPIYKEKFDLATPLYHRQRFDGLLVRNLLYPMVRSVYGKRVCEPLATEFALSGRLASHVAEQEFWREAENVSSPEIWITTFALLGDFRVCQSFLGPKGHVEKDARQDFVGTLRRAVGTFFRCMDAQESFWLSKTNSEPVPTFGFPYEIDLKSIRFNRRRMLQMFRTGVTELASILQVILAEETFREIQELARLSDDEFRYSDELWVKSVYDFAGAFHRSVMNRDHIVQALAPLYRGRVGAFVIQNHEASTGEIDKAIENLCEECERLKPYLVGRWNAK
jgi:glucosylglycerate synthase